MSAQSKDGLEAATASFIALSTIAVGLRIYTRKSQRLPFKADDGFAVLALLSLTFETAMNLAATFIKLSALAFYWRHFALPGCNPWIKRVIIGTAIVVSLWPIIIITVTFLQCGTHLAAYWQGTEDVYCHITKPFYPTIPLTILILDLWILMIPIPKVSHIDTFTLTK
ncbi:hypothetical protein ANO11243_017650 [Dothideomycetidae sp. 11243]|nr:hypothetical protein ANO11243_017650 [fungal sp. No.11243]